MYFVCVLMHREGKASLLSRMKLGRNAFIPLKILVTFPLMWSDALTL